MDLFSLLQEQYTQAGSTIDRRTQQFINWAREYLANNPPVRTAMINVGIGLTLRQGQVVAFQPQTTPRVRNGGIRITNEGISPDNIEDKSAVSVTTGSGIGDATARLKEDRPCKGSRKSRS